MAGKEQRTTMSVPEMGRMLGLSKTEGYWLVHKNYFATILVEGKMRIVIESFEKWYVRQIKYHKVDGPPPGDALKEKSYSVRDIAEMFNINEAWMYVIIKQQDLPTILVNGWKRIPREAFEKWYAGQTRYRKPEDRERDREAEEGSMTIPEMGRLLSLDRRAAYKLAYHYRDQLEVITIADRKRVTKESFEAWYAGQSEYVKFTDLPKEEQDRITSANKLSKKKKQMPRLEIPADKPAYTAQEAAVLMDIDIREVYRLISCGELTAKKYGTSYRIRRDEIQWWLVQQKMNVEE